MGRSSGSRVGGRKRVREEWNNMSEEETTKEVRHATIRLHSLLHAIA